MTSSLYREHSIAKFVPGVDIYERFFIKVFIINPLKLHFV